MKTLRDELAAILKVADEAQVAESFREFCQRNASSLPLPGEDLQFDQLMWMASEHFKLSAQDEALVNRVSARLVAGYEVKSESARGADSVSGALRLKDLLGHGQAAAMDLWQEMLAALSWQQMVPAGALRNAGGQVISLGTIQRVLDDANVQVNIGWIADKQQLRILLQAKDTQEQALSDVELRIKEQDGTVVYSRTTNEDGAVVAPSLPIAPGRYRIEVVRGDSIAQTPYFDVA